MRARISSRTVSILFITLRHNSLLISNVVTVVLHPFFKMTYIDLHWSDNDEEYYDDLANGNRNARKWKQYAHEVVEEAVRILQYHKLS